MKSTLTDDDIRFYCKKYELNICNCVDNINRIKKIANSIKGDFCKEIKILKSVDDLYSKGLSKCDK